jgi:hypothetical protein
MQCVLKTHFAYPADIRECSNHTLRVRITLVRVKVILSISYSVLSRMWIKCTICVLKLYTDLCTSHSYMLKPHSAFRTHLSKCWNHTLLVKSRRLCVKIVKSGKIPLVHFKTTLGFFVLCVKWYLACQNHTQRVANSIKIILWGSNHTFRVEITLCES